MKRDVSESYTAMFLQYSGVTAGPSLPNLDLWTVFTNTWTEQHVWGTIAWAPRVPSGNFGDFDPASRQTCAGYSRWSPGGHNIFDFSSDVVEAVDYSNRVGNGSEPSEDAWPVIFARPAAKTPSVGLNVASLPGLESAIERMLESNRPIIAPVAPSPTTGLPWFAVLQPVFEKTGERVAGLVVKTTAVQELCLDALEATAFVDHFPRADIALFLRTRDAHHPEDDYLLFDLAIDHSRAGRTGSVGIMEEEYRRASKTITPQTAKTRGSHHFVYTLELTQEVSVLFVASFDPDSAGGSGEVRLAVCGCVASLLVALLVYGRQALVVHYKLGMERATMISRFKSRVVADMSHEVRTPLNGIIGMAELLEDERLPVSAGEMVRTVRSCSNILLGM